MKRAIVILALLSCVDAATAETSIVGGWYYGPGYPSDDGVVITFFEDGVYYMAEDGEADAGGGPGMERGTYVFDAVAKSLSATTLDDTTGDWGLSHATITSAEVSGDTLEVRVEGEPLPFLFARIADPLHAIVGSWYTGPAFPHDNSAVLSFLPHGNYFMAEHGTADDGGMPGMERGDYSWDGANGIVFNGGALQGVPWRDTTGDWGLSHANVLGITIEGDRMIATVEGQGDVEFMRIPSAIPEPEAYATMIVGLALLGLVRVRRRSISGSRARA